MSYLDQLNPEQARAVTQTEGPVLIIAGAGSGKTRVITFRIAHMLRSGVPQSAILALTFTNKASREMQQRIRELTGEKLARLTISTFHAFGVRMLKKYITRLGFRENFSIYDQQDQISLLKETAREIKFPLDRLDLNFTLGLFSKVKTGRARLNEEYAELRELYREHQEHLKLYNAVDFDDLIVLPQRILTECPDVLAEVREQYRYILVDEFQDTSSEQYNLMHMLSSESRNVCVVGDDDQSIYSWRGANYENFLQFDRHYPERLEIKLEQNYRSTDTILRAANVVIANNTNRRAKELWTGQRATVPIELCFPEDEAEEARYIARTIKSLSVTEKLTYHDVGVLIRTNALSRAIEEEFLAQRIPYKVSGGQSFFSRSEIKDCIAYMRVAANPDDDISLLRVLNTPRRGIGRKTLEVLNEQTAREKTSLYIAMQALVNAEDSPLSSRAKADLEGFLKLVEDYRASFFSSKGIAKTLEALIDEVDYWQYLVIEHQRNDQIAKWKFRNIALFIASIQDYEKDPDTIDPSLYDYLSRISLNLRDDPDAASGDGQVQLMTIHAAKGLEHEVVFLAGAEENIIPHAKSVEENPDALEEERRLFYVALTRAKRKLYLSACRNRRVMRERVSSSPSPFIDEIPAELVQVSELDDALEPETAVDYFAALKNRFAPGA